VRSALLLSSNSNACESDSSCESRGTVDMCKNCVRLKKQF
jgi:hypothetical protein